MASDHKRIIVAVDFPDLKQTQTFLKKISPQSCRVKVGLTLFTAQGPAIIEQIHNQGYEIFLDLKFHDIPKQVAGACHAAAELGVWMLNVHASGGEEMLLSAREAIDRTAHKPLLIAVTALTSLNKDYLHSMNLQHATIIDWVKHLTQAAVKAKLDGVVCSGLEVEKLREQMPAEFKFIVPGIRFAEKNITQDDQQRILTPSAAIKNGASYLVIGRPITEAHDPQKIIDQINLDIH